MRAGGVVTYLVVAVTGTFAMSVLAAWRLRTQRRTSAVSGYSAVEKALALGVCGVGWFGFLALLEFGRTTGILRLVLVTTAFVVAAVGAALVWHRFGSALRWDADGLTYFGPLRIERIQWTSMRRAHWDNRARALVIEYDKRVLRLPADLDGVRRMASEMPSRLRSE